LTPAGAANVGLDEFDDDNSAVMPHPPKSATR
jgi:hypothetical protein